MPQPFSFSPASRWEHSKDRNLFLCQGDITRAPVEAIVNAANPALAGGGGVDGSIHRASGPRLLEACREIVRQSGELPTGEAVATPGFNISVDAIIHTVGPIWRGGGHKERELLFAAYINSLRLASQRGLASVAFPAISCGAYGFPTPEAAPLALRAMSEGLENHLVQTAALYLYSPEAYKTWRAIARNVLGEELESFQ